VLFFVLIRKFSFFFITAFLFASFSVSAAGGVSIQGTRIIYPQNSRQESISLRNSSATDSFLVQSWIENANGKKSKDFIVTPPLYLSGPKNENTLRLMLAAPDIAGDREVLYYFVAKAIPSIDSKDTSGRSVIRIAAASRIKLFIRPSGLKIKPEKAPAELSFKRLGKKIEITNPTPYYITMTEIKHSGRSIAGVMVPPIGTMLLDTPSDSNNTLTFSTINDSGAITKPQTVIIK